MIFLSLWRKKWFLRHCEERSDEAIQRGNVGTLDCFATLAMTDKMDYHDFLTKISQWVVRFAYLPSFALQNLRQWQGELIARCARNDVVGMGFPRYNRNELYTSHTCRDAWNVELEKWISAQMHGRWCLRQRPRLSTAEGADLGSDGWKPAKCSCGAFWASLRAAVLRRHA